MSAITYGWEKDVSGEDKFWLKFPRCSREPGSWKDELYAAARAITNSTTKPIYVCSSGGIDSELVCRAFFDQGIHFRVLTVEHTAGTNQYDIQYAKKWCRDHDVEQTILRLDMPHFLDVDVRSYAKEGYVTGNVFRYFQLKLLEEVERLGGFAVFGGGEQLYNVDKMQDGATSEAYLKFETGYAVPLEWCKRNNTAHEPYFFFSRPEVVLSYLRIPIVGLTVRDRDVFLHPKNSYMFKRIVYQSQWLDLESRRKYSGYEHILPLRRQAERLLEQDFGSKIQIYRLPVATLLEQLSPQQA